MAWKSKERFFSEALSLFNLCLLMNKNACIFHSSLPHHGNHNFLFLAFSDIFVVLTHLAYRVNAKKRDIPKNIA